jgi:hypothetical protein
MRRMPTASETASMTFFFVTDVVRATDHSREPSWSKPGVSLTQPVTSWSWAAAKTKR